METIEQYRIEAEQRQAILTAINDEKTIKVINAENKLKQIAKDFVSFMDVNKDRIDGKKLFLTDGGLSKVFKAVVDEFVNSLNLDNQKESCYLNFSYNSVKLVTRICCIGGKYAETRNEITTAYCIYVDRNFYDLITVDADGKLLKIVENVDELVGDDFNVGQYQIAINAIKDHKEEIKAIEEQINKMERFIPYSLKK